MASQAKLLHKCLNVDTVQWCIHTSCSVCKAVPEYIWCYWRVSLSVRYVWGKHRYISMCNRLLYHLARITQFNLSGNALLHYTLPHIPTCIILVLQWFELNDNSPPFPPI